MATYYRAKKDGGEVLVICEYDTFDQESPLTWTDPVNDHRPLFVLSHRRYNLGDEYAEDTAWKLFKAADKWNDDWLDEEIMIQEDGLWISTGEDNPDYINLDDGLEAIITAADRIDAHVMPVYTYDHSGIHLSLGRDYPFNSPWDAGCIGIMLWTQEQQHAWENGAESDARKVMESYFEEYRQYVEGEVYTLSVIEVPEELEDMEDDLDFCIEQGNEISSCGGVYLSSRYDIETACLDLFGLTDVEEL